MEGAPVAVAVASAGDSPSVAAATGAAVAAAASAIGLDAGSTVDVSAAAASAAVAANAALAVWFYQEPITQQMAGPWTVAQIRDRLKSHRINGMTPVWRQGSKGGWQPLSEVDELKAELRGEDDDANEEEDASKRLRRPPLEDVPILHTYTDERGQLFIFDVVDEDWKDVDLYEALVKDDQEVEKTIQAVASGEVVTTPVVQEKTQAEKEEEEALLELAAAAEKLRPMAGAAGAPSNLSKPSPATSSSKAIGVKVPQDMQQGQKRPLNNGDQQKSGASTAAGPDKEGVDAETEAKRQKRRDYRERRKLKKQAGLFVKASENPNIYVSGLPPDVTLEELEPIFKRAGVLKLDPDTGKSKIRIYMTPDESACKGDALVSYAHAASVELAIKFLHEYELRPNCKLCIQQADFEEKDQPKLSKKELEALAASKQGEVQKAKFLAAKNARKDAMSWTSDIDDGTGKKIVVLKNMFLPDEADGKSEFYDVLTGEVASECEKFGEVTKVTPMEGHILGIVCVKFRDSVGAEECVRGMEGRYYRNRNIEASFYDGKSDLRILGKATVPVKKQVAVEVSKPPVPAAAEIPVIEAVQGPAIQGPTLPAGPLPTVDEEEEDAAAEDEEMGPVGPAGPPVQGSKDYQDWLDNQSSSSDDEEFAIRTEE